MSVPPPAPGAECAFTVPRKLIDANEEFYTNALRSSGTIGPKSSVKSFTTDTMAKGAGLMGDMAFLTFEYNMVDDNRTPPKVVCGKFTPAQPSVKEQLWRVRLCALGTALSPRTQPALRIHLRTITPWCVRAVWVHQ